MKANLYPLQNRGMSRDMSVSKADNVMAWENHNIRVTARDHDTLLSVTNERGTKEIILPEGTIKGSLVGWNVLNNHIILFTTENDSDDSGSSSQIHGLSVYPQELVYNTDGGNKDVHVMAQNGDAWYLSEDGGNMNPDAGGILICDYIYRIDYDGENFRMVCGDTDDDGVDAAHPEYGKPLYEGCLGFNKHNAIESIVCYEAANIQKIYWIDGRHVLRFMNFMETLEDRKRWDDTYFDSNRIALQGLDVVISKTNSGNNRANGVVQYLVTYYNRHGQETGYVWASDLVYLSPIDNGGSPDGTNANLIRLDISGLDDSFSHYKVYSIFRSSRDVNAVAYVVADNAMPIDGRAIVVDDGANLETTDVRSLLFLGSRDVIASTMAAKDNTLFLGGISSAGVSGYDALEEVIHREMFVDGANFSYGTTYEVKDECLWFTLTDVSDISSDESSIPLAQKEGFYSYESQLKLTSSHIQSFKGHEKYRFALVFRTASGVSSKAFWIGDKVNRLYPEMVNNIVRRPIVKCVVPSAVVDVALNAGYVSVGLMIARADASDRNVIAQGIINPTMFNVWDRYKNRLYSYASWITRPRHSGYASSHFEPVHNSITRSGEIQCNFWNSDNAPTPFYRSYVTGGTKTDGTEVVQGGLVDELPDVGYTQYKLIYYIQHGDRAHLRQCRGGWILLRANTNSGTPVDDTIMTKERQADVLGTGGRSSMTTRKSYAYSGYTINYEVIKYITSEFYNYNDFWTKQIYESLKAYLDAADIVSYEKFIEEIGGLEEMFDNGLTAVIFGGTYNPTKCQTLVHYTKSADGTVTRHNYVINGFDDDSFNRAVAHIATGPQEALAHYTFVWNTIESTVLMHSDSNKYISSYYKKHLFFVDENVVTLNSPEFEYETVYADRLSDAKLRIVGIAKIDSNISDYTVEHGRSKKAGENLLQESFSTEMTSANPDGLLTAPLYAEYGLIAKDTIPKFSGLKSADVLLGGSVDSSDYKWSSRSVWYWLHMWHKTGGITGVSAGDGFADEDSTVSNNDEKTSVNIDIDNASDTTLYSELQHKTFATLRYSYGTIYSSIPVIYSAEDVRHYTYTDSQYTSLSVGGIRRSYNANINTGINMPLGIKYPVCYSDAGYMDADTPSWYLGSDEQVLMQYKSSAHAVISLGKDNGKYMLLPKVAVGSQTMDAYEDPSPIYDSTVVTTDGLLSWTGDENSDSNVEHFSSSQKEMVLPEGTLSRNDRYVFIGELYRDADGNEYNGISKAAIESNTFITAGPIVNLLYGQDMTVIGNQGDTYFQRWDCLKTKPYDSTHGNNVTDITSVMLETHINIDGRYDTMRGQKMIASMNIENYGKINPVYSQENNFFAANDVGDEHTVDAYKSTITWTEEKSPSADTDKWSHITLATSLNLDGDKGLCRALRRFQNNILAFQDRGVAEIMFNSRTQIATTEGIPIEIANSGKVDGKNYISNKYGCINKWSIVEGKNGLYFIDNINKMIGMYNGQSLSSLTSAAYLDVWMREHNSLDIWSPEDNGNFVSYYDRIHSDVYFIGSDKKNPCLVYNEVLGNFTGFFDYSDVPMMTNIGDRFVSFHTLPSGGNALWLQNEGMYNTFFGVVRPFYMIWRITPEPYGDKIWGSLEYRVDFFKVLMSMGDMAVDEYSPVGGQRFVDGSIVEGDYQQDMTFDEVEVWNEYQSTGKIKMSWNGKDSTETYPDIRKKFRIWRADIPRAQKNETNIYGLDRIRNPWIWLKIGMSYDKLDNTCMMLLHDINVKYFTNE